MIPRAEVLEAILEGPLPLYVYDLARVTDRAQEAKGLLGAYYFPVKTCPDPEVIATVTDTGCGLDLCSSGDLEIAQTAGADAALCSFTSPHLTSDLAQRMASWGARLDADSIAQAETWARAGGRRCGLRVATGDRDSLYSIKFGVAAHEMSEAIGYMTNIGLEFVGIHIHDNYRDRAPMEMAERLIDAIGLAGPKAVQRAEYVNIGGGWPLPAGMPSSAEHIRPALRHIAQRLAASGFKGELTGEPGEWVVGPCGFWAARVSAIKRNPFRQDRLIAILDTATPIPCRPSLAPFFAVRDLALVQEGVGQAIYDIFGSANTGADTIGLAVSLPPLQEGDIVVSSMQGAYSQSLTSNFNERPVPTARYVRA